MKSENRVASECLASDRVLIAAYGLRGRQSKIGDKAIISRTVDDSSLTVSQFSRTSLTLLFSPGVSQCHQDKSQSLVVIIMSAVIRRAGDGETWGYRLFEPVQPNLMVLTGPSLRVIWIGIVLWEPARIL